MAQVAASFGSSKNLLVSSSNGFTNTGYSAVTALGPTGSSAVYSISANLTSCKINSANLIFNQPGSSLQSSQTSIWPFTVYFFTAAPSINGGAVWDWQYSWNNTYLGGISMIGVSNSQTGSTASVYSSALGFGSGTQPGINGQPIDIILSAGTTLNNLYFVVITNYVISAVTLVGVPTYVLSLNVSTL